MRLVFKLTAFVVLFSASLLNAQMADNWKWLNPAPQGNSLNAVDFIDNNTGYAAGDYGTILKTSNGGSSWQQIYSFDGKDIMSMSFVNASIGYVGGASQMLRKTVDGGQTWQNIQLPVNGNWDTAYYVMDIQFINQNVGYVCGFFQLESKIWKTTDGGTTWATQSTGDANYIFELYFLDENTGFGYGGPTYTEVIKTTNGGASWYMVSQESYIAYSMYFITPQIGIYGCEQGRVYRTTDGGETWNYAICPSSVDIYSMQFINANTGFGFGSGSVYVKTTDGGMNWDELIIPGGSIRQYYDAEATPNGTIHAVGSFGTMIRTTNAGTTFLSQPYVTERSISNIKFVDVNTGYAVSGYGQGDILKTTNSGETWVSQVSTYTLPLYGISFIDAQTGYLAGSINIKKTTNGGTNWVDVYTSTTNEIFGDVFFTNVNTGYAVGSYSKVLKTTNAGVTWSPSTIPGGGTFASSVFFVNDNIGYIVGDDADAFKTTNAGANWLPMNVNTGFINNNTVFFDDMNTGYISTGDGIYKTTNGGDVWTPLNTPGGGYNNVQFRGNYGYAIGGSGKIIKTIDGGNTWIVQPTVTENSLYALYFNSDDYVYAGGLLGCMIKTIPMELLMTPVSGNSNEVPKKYFLQQNYPNPFNPTTTIKFGITKTGFVSVKVYDITGRLISELVNNNFNPGSYEVKWDGSGFSSGVYFYTITTNEFTETRKMILTK